MFVKEVFENMLHLISKNGNNVLALERIDLFKLQFQVVDAVVQS